MEPKRKHYLAQIPTIALLVLLGLAPQVAIILFILRAIDRKAARKEQAAQAPQFQAGSAAQTHGPARAAYIPYDYTPSPDAPTSEQRSAQKRQKSLINLCTLLGGFLVFTGLVTLGEGFDQLTAFGVLDELLSGLAQLVGGGGALILGLRIKRARKLEQQLDKVVGDRDNIPLEELFAAAGLPYEQGRKLLENAIDHGYFGAGAYIDNRTDFLVVRGPAPIPAQPPEEQPAPEPGQYDAMLEQFRVLGQAVESPALRAKIQRLEQLARQIFALAEKDPDKAPQLKKFTEYYLPTSFKLLNTYAQMEQPGIQGENISEAKQSIERSMDMLITAFENQLDKLFQADALDVSADISALEGMLNLDGLTGKQDFGLGNP